MQKLTKYNNLAFKSYWFSSNPTILFQQDLASKGENKIMSFLQKEKSKLDISGRQKGSREAVSMNQYLEIKSYS